MNKKTINKITLSVTAVILGSIGMVSCSEALNAPTEMQEAFCTDLNNGLSLFQIFKGTEEYFDSDPLRFAVYAHDAMEAGCQEQLDIHQNYFEEWGIE